MRTRVFIDEFKGNKIFSIWEVDASESKVGQYPLFSVGAKKAIALMMHLEEFKQYAEISKNELERITRK